MIQKSKRKKNLKFNVPIELWILMHLHYKFKHSQYDIQNELKCMKLNSHAKIKCKPQTQSQP